MVGEYTVRLASGLAREADTFLWLSNEDTAPHLSELSADVDHRAFAKPQLRHPFRQMAMLFRLVREVREFRPDVVHIQQGHLWLNLAIPLLRRYPLVITIHDAHHHPGDRESQKTPQWVFHYGFRRALKLIVHSTALKEEIRSSLGVRDERVSVVPMVAHGTDKIPDLTFEEDHTVLFFGRIWEYKGLEYLIRAEPLVSAEFPDAKFIIGGRGEDFDHYRRMMVNPDRFEVHNEYVSYEDRDKLFQRASIVVLPYIEASQSGVVPVAYSFAKPVVVTKVGGLPEAVIDGVTGLLVAPRDEVGLAQAIIRLLRDRESRRQMGEAGLKMLAEYFSPKAIATQTLSVYQDAIDEFNRDVRGAANARN